MKKELYIQIPEPCHEDWNKMIPVQQGRYCQSCSKEVIDFSIMTDQEIIKFLSKPRGGTCGNFSSDQLDRVIKEPATPAKKRIWAVMFSFLLPFFVSIKAKAQFRAKHVADTIKTSVSLPDALAGRLGGLIMVVHEPEIKSYTVSGKVTDTSGNILPNATVQVKGTHIGTSANDNGEYKLSLPNGKNVILQVSYAGFQNQEISVLPKSDSVRQDIKLTLIENQLTDVVIICKAVSRKVGIYAGGISIVRREQLTNTVIDTVKNLINPTQLKVYPNPVSKNNFVYVQPTGLGNFKLTVADNQGKLIQQTAFSISAKRQAYQLELPSSIASGIYYINVIDEKSKKQYTQKLIVQ